ncbi:MAG TPA: hypothetical protein VFV47_05435 [Hyphomicrobiaceae bacterium]|nr:hypothetical protein [Hyphomicrobiaceae bacterium]
MFAIICKADGFPVSRQVGNGTPDLVVTWTSQDSAKAFLASKGLEAEYQVVALTDDSLNRMATVLGCPADSIAFDAYPS